MKLAEALAQRKDLTTKIAELTRRAQRVATAPDGQEPAESPYALIEQVEDRSAELRDLVARINATNVQPLPDGSNIAALIVERDYQKGLAQFYRGLAEHAVPDERWTRSEIVRVPAVDAAALADKADRAAHAARLIDLRIQELDWQVELV